MTVIVCATCEKPFELETSPAPPFCSHRCKLIDLGRWISEEQGVPIEPEDDSEESWE